MTLSEQLVEAMARTGYGSGAVRDLSSGLLVALDEEEIYVSPDQYHSAIRKCPPSWNLDSSGRCVQVRPGPKKFRLGDLEPDVAAKIKASLAKSGTSTPRTMDAIIHEPVAAAPVGAKTTPMRPSENEARVGLCGSCVVPPEKVPRLPNLTHEEREAESRFASSFEAYPDKMVDIYMDSLDKGEIGDAPNIFAMDDAKLLSPDYNPQGKSDTEVLDARSTMNIAVHQTANAICKRAFLRKLDELAKLPKDDEKRSVLVTSGGVASGKGFALGNVQEASSIAKTVGAVWDAAGEQNATENDWVLDELEKRGLKGAFVFVDSDPKDTWENPQRGVVERAGSNGRMGDARLFSDSYAEGAKNFAAFHSKNKDRASFLILSSRAGKPTLVSEMPREALAMDAAAIYARTSKVIDERPEI